MTSESLKALINSRVRAEVLFVRWSHPAFIQDTSCVHLWKLHLPRKEVLKLLSILTQVLTCDTGVVLIIQDNLGHLMQGRKEIILYYIHSLILRSKYRVSSDISHMEQNCNHYQLRNCSLPKMKIDPNTLFPSVPLPFPHFKCWIRNWFCTVL